VSDELPGTTQQPLRVFSPWEHQLWWLLMDWGLNLTLQWLLSSWLAGNDV